MNMEASHFNLVAGAGDDAADDTSASPSKLEYQRRMRSNLMQDAASSKILAFKEKAPTPKEGFQNEMRVLYTQNKAACKTKAASRVIPQTPDRILDAPEMRADFYLNLLDWSKQNHIAVALGDTVYLWNAESGDITELCHTENPGDYISSVSWAFDGAHLAVGTRDSAVQIWDVTQSKKVRKKKRRRLSLLHVGSKNGLALHQT
jgi:cell division cycle protein 20 (cofactor of APC complex)